MSESATDPGIGDDVDADDTRPADAAEPQFPAMEVWFEQWFAPVIARKLTGVQGKGRVWCPQWWRHHEVAVRLDALWRGWEGATASQDPSAMSSWWVHHTDAHLRVILDAENGPMYLCSKDKHTGTPKLSKLLITPPAGWFDTPDRTGA